MYNSVRQGLAMWPGWLSTHFIAQALLERTAMPLSLRLLCCGQRCRLPCPTLVFLSSPGTHCYWILAPLVNDVFVQLVYFALSRTYWPFKFSLLRGPWGPFHLAFYLAKRFYCGRSLMLVRTRLSLVRYILQMSPLWLELVFPYVGEEKTLQMNFSVKQ